LKRIEILSVFAIGLSLIAWSQWLYQDTSEQARKLAQSKPIQIPIEKNISQITKDFYPELDAPYEVFLISASSGNNHQIGKASTMVKIAKAEVFRDDKKIDIFKSDAICSDRYARCHIAHFKSIANRKHTIIIGVENIDPRLYALNPKIDVGISQMYRAKGLIGNSMQILALMLLGVVILFLLIFCLILEFIAKIYKQIK
jgi:hypothetical protein